MGFCNCSMFRCTLLCPFLFCNHLDGEERAGCFTLFDFLVSHGCSVGPPRVFGDLGRMAIYFQGTGEHW